MYVNPSKAYPMVFIFNISKTIEERGTYEATRKYWGKISNFQYSSDMIAIGLEKGIAKGIYRIEKWYQSKDKGYEDRFEFEGKEDSELTEEFLDKDFSNITSRTGFWNFGNWLAVEFNGKGSFTFKRPANDSSVYSCTDDSFIESKKKL